MDSQVKIISYVHPYKILTGLPGVARIIFGKKSYNNTNIYTYFIYFIDQTAPTTFITS